VAYLTGVGFVGFILFFSGTILKIARTGEWLFNWRLADHPDTTWERGLKYTGFALLVLSIGSGLALNR
jgi:hypothetical protein